MKEFLILTINPGSTSTKYSLYKGDKPVLDQKISHSETELKKFEKIFDQYEFRKNLILDSLKKHGYNVKDLNCVVGRGGLLKPIPGGIYEVNDQMVSDLKNSRAEHASNLGGVIARDIAKEAGVKAFIADPVVVDEFEDIARVSGNKLIERQSIFHALNHKATAKKYAKEVGKKYEDLNLVVAHMGGGITIGAHRKGRVIDNNNGLDGEGPFSPERSGTLPVGSLVDLCFSGKYTKAEVKNFIKGGGGMVSYLGSNDMKEVMDRVRHGNKEAKFYFDAMIYQIAKEIGAYSTVLEGKIDAILLTGGLANEKYLIDNIMPKISWIAKVQVYPGENEMESLCYAGQVVLAGEEKAKEYK